MWVNRYATVLAFCTFFLLISGGLVSVMEAGMACGFDWPLCQGEYFPHLVDGKQYEHPHRLTAMLVGILTFGLCGVLFRFRRADRTVLRLGASAVLLVVVQALLGRLTVKLALPPWVSSVHQATAMAFFCLTVSIAFIVRQRSLDRYRPRIEPAARPRRGALLAVIGLTYTQVVAGAVMRHTRGGLACGFEFPLCLGSLWPSGHVALQAHLVHRILGAAVAMVFLGLSVRLRAFRLNSAVARLSASLAIGVILQVLLGIMTIFTSRDIVVMTLHSSIGAAILAGSVALYWLVYPSTIGRAATVRPFSASNASLELA